MLKKKTMTHLNNNYDDLEIFVKEYKDKTKPLIEVNNLSKIFKKKFKTKQVFSDISFNIYPNERLALLGPNGAGKTILTSIICGMSKQTSGEIKYNYKFNKKPYEKLSVQFQDLQFPNSLTPKDLIEFSLYLNKTEYNEQEINEGIKEFCLEEIITTKITKLSGGQQQRLNVFIAMLGKPKVLFLDEFTTGLDIAIKNRLQKYIMKFCSKYKIALVLISHDIDVIKNMCNRFIILANHKIMLNAKTEDVVKKFKSVEKMLNKYIIE